MSEHKEPIPSMIYNASVGGHVTNSQQIIDENENKEQSQINAEVTQAIGQGGSVDSRIIQAKNDIIGGASSNGNTLKKIEDRVSPLESAVGTGGSVDSRIASAVATETTRAQAKEQLLQEQYDALTQNDIVVGTLPGSGTKNLIYRVPGTNSYSDYMWNGTQFVKMAEYDNAIDDEPTAGSNNLVKSGGIAKYLGKFKENKGWMDSSGNVSDIDTGHHIVIPVDPLKQHSFSLKRGPGNIVYAFLASYTVPIADGEQYDLVSGTDRVAVLSGDAMNLYTPLGCSYLWIGVNVNSSTQNFPSLIIVDDYNYNEDIISNIKESLVNIDNFDKTVLNGFTPIRGWMNDQDKSDHVDDGGSHIVFKVDPTRQVPFSIYRGEGNIVYAFLASYEIPIKDGESYNLVSGYHRVAVESGDAINLYTPIGCEYLWIGLSVDNSIRNKPSKVIIDGYDYIKTVIENVTNINNEIDTINSSYISKDYAYMGEAINLNKFGFKVLTALQQNNKRGQGIALYNNYLFVGFSNYQYLEVFDVTTGAYLGRVSLDMQYHCNSMAFSSSGNGQFPYLYVNEWDGNRSIGVYSITHTNNVWAAEKIQSISVENLTDSIGAGYLDAVVDNEGGYLYIIAYTDADNYLATNNNKTKISKFQLPSLSSENVSLQDADCISSFIVPIAECRQESIFYNGKIYLACGIQGYGEGKLELRVIDIEKEKYVSVVDLSIISTKEPEGIWIYKEGLIYYTSDNNNLYFLKF